MNQRHRISRVAFQGELGAFSEEAVLAFFGQSAEPLPQRQFEDVAAAVVQGNAEYGLLPIENTTVGAVSAVCDVLAQNELVVVGEVVCAVRHCLLGHTGARLDTIRHAYSHPVALGQCAIFFSRHPHIEPLATYDTAGAAKQVAATGDPVRAAVAGRRAADRYGLEILAEDIQDRSDNQTRFLIVSRAPDLRDQVNGEWKTALLIETANQPGALVAALVPFADRKINLSHLQSRPGRDAWTYWFFLEVEAAQDDDRLRAALAEIVKQKAQVRVLGSFPRWSGNRA